MAHHALDAEGEQAADANAQTQAEHHDDTRRLGLGLVDEPAERKDD